MGWRTAKTVGTNGRFQPGQPKRGGRKPGTPNKVTQTVKQAFEAAFADLQPDSANPAHLVNWAKANPSDFYRIASKLIPEQVSGDLNLQVLVTKYTPECK